MIWVIIVCVVLLVVVNKYLKGESAVLLWLSNLGLGLAIVVSLLHMSGLIGR